MDRLFLYRLILENTFFLECFFSSFWYFIPINPYVSGFFSFCGFKIFPISAVGECRLTVRNSFFLYRLESASVRCVRTGEILAMYGVFSLYQTGLDCFLCTVFRKYFLRSFLRMADIFEGDSLCLFCIFSECAVIREIGN